MQYLPTGRLEASGPLNRFLPPVPEGTARAYVAGLEPSTAWVLEPFVAQPRLAVEMARAGHRVLATAGNPVSRFLLDLAAHPPKLVDLQAALADLAAARKEGKRLETHLQSLYATRCENCGREISAEAFLWDGKTGELTGRIYNCICGSGGEHPATPEDVEIAALWARTDGLHRSRAIERVVPGNDPDRPFAEEALGFYLPRAVYALGTIINRLDGLSSSDERRRCMSALVLYAADCANVLWPHLSERPRPKQLTFSSVYRENNIWLALEAGVKAWASEESPIPLTLWPEEPPESGGVCVFEGPLRDLAHELEGHPIKAVVTAIPRPNQAFWTLSALWAGWLWGHVAVGPFKAVLRRRRYDWQWHAEALRALFENLVEVLQPGIPVFGILAEPEAGFVSAVFLAAQAARLEINGLAMRAEADPVQLLWKKLPSLATTPETVGKNSSGRSTAGQKKKALPLNVNYTGRLIRETLSLNNEPMPYLHLHTAILAVLAQKGMLTWSDEALSTLEKNIHTALASPDFVDLEGRTTPETGTWALKKWDYQEMFKGL
ncbi:MAG TPA: hypothetical protein VGK00_04295 [Anaerolineales bacterium]